MKKGSLDKLRKQFIKAPLPHTKRDSSTQLEPVKLFCVQRITVYYRILGNVCYSSKEGMFRVIR